MPYFKKRTRIAAIQDKVLEAVHLNSIGADLIVRANEKTSEARAEIRDLATQQRAVAETLLVEATLLDHVAVGVGVGAAAVDIEGLFADVAHI